MPQEIEMLKCPICDKHSQAIEAVEIIVHTGSPNAYSSRGHKLYFHCAFCDCKKVYYKVKR